MEVEGGGGEVVEEPEAGQGGRGLAGRGGSSKERSSGDSCSEPSKGGKPTLRKSSYSYHHLAFELKKEKMEMNKEEKLNKKGKRENIEIERK